MSLRSLCSHHQRITVTWISARHNKMCVVLCLNSGYYDRHYSCNKTSPYLVLTIMLIDVLSNNSYLGVTNFNRHCAPDVTSRRSVRYEEVPCLPSMFHFSAINECYNYVTLHPEYKIIRLKLSRSFMQYCRNSRAQLCCITLLFADHLLPSFIYG